MLDLEEVADDLAKRLISPPSAKSAIKMIELTETLYVAAISGMLQNTVHCQHSLDASYIMLDEATDQVKARMHDILAVLAKANGLKTKGESSINDKTRAEILKEIDK